MVRAIQADLGQYCGAAMLRQSPWVPPYTLQAHVSWHTSGTAASSSELRCELLPGWGISSVFQVLSFLSLVPINFAPLQKCYSASQSSSWFETMEAVSWRCYYFQITLLEDTAWSLIKAPSSSPFARSIRKLTWLYFLSNVKCLSRGIPMA